MPNIQDKTILDSWYKTIYPVSAAVDRINSDIADGSLQPVKYYYDYAVAHNTLSYPIVTLIERIAAWYWYLTGKVDTDSGELPQHYWKHGDQLKDAENNKTGLVLVGGEASAKGSWSALVFVIEDGSLVWVHPVNSSFEKV